MALTFNESSISARWWRNRLNPLQCLNACLFVNANGNLSPLGNKHRIHLHDVSHLLIEERVLAVQPHPEFPGTEIHLVEDVPHRRRADVCDATELDGRISNGRSRPLGQFETVVLR
jgi:hypothetical protein